MTLYRALIGTLVVCLVSAVTAGAAEPAKIRWKRTQLDEKFRSEGVAVADFNGDGKLDVAAGSVWYAAPDWKMNVVAEKAMEYDPHGYANSFVNFAYDVSGDGRPDLIVVDFPGKETWWFENPPKAEGPWKRHVATPVTNNESPQFLDVDGDGKPELIAGVAPSQNEPDGPMRQMALIRPNADRAKLWDINPISKQAADGVQRYSHGLGLGDINRDGRMDVVVPQGWWEAPASKADGEWAFHAAPFGKPCGHMHIYDFDGDGDNDVVSSSAHEFGVWWYEQTPEGWKTHEIDMSFSQSHSMCLADINGDKLPDFVTGKRWWAHGPGGDPGRDQPAVIMWFELKQDGPGKCRWISHEIDHDSGIGTQFEVADINKDGLPDVITSNKKGVYVFEQLRE